MLLIPLPKTLVKQSSNSHQVLVSTNEVALDNEAKPTNIAEAGFIEQPTVMFNSRSFGEAPSLNLLPDVEDSKLVEHGERLLIINSGRVPIDKVSMLNNAETTTP